MQLVCEGLPERQSQVVILAAQGHGEKATAKAMNCSVANIRALRSTVFYKWHAQNITSAVAEGFKRGHLKYIPILLVCLCSAMSASDHQYRPIRRNPRIERVVRTINHRSLSALI